MRFQSRGATAIGFVLNFAVGVINFDGEGAGSGDDRRRGLK